MLSLCYPQTMPPVVHFVNHRRKKFFYPAMATATENAGKRRNISKYSRGRHTSPYKAFTAIFSRGAIYCKGKRRGVFRAIYGRLSAKNFF